MIDVLCITHTDSDGWCSGAIVKHFEENVTIHHMNYGYDIPWNKIKQARKVYMTDFGLQPFKEMLKIKKMKGDNFIWIDHHKTAIDDLKKSGQKINGTQRIGDAGCELTWEYFSDEKMPEIVRLIGRYDVWDIKYSDKLFPLQSALTLYGVDSNSDTFWKTHLTSDDHLDELIKEGQLCCNYHDNINYNNCKSHSFELDWKGYRFLAINALGSNSKIFDSKFDPSKHDAMLCFGYTNKNYSVSMYSTKNGVDVGSIAKSLGGGGHKNASGFQCLELPFELEWKRKG